MDTSSSALTGSRELNTTLTPGLWKRLPVKARIMAAAAVALIAGILALAVLHGQQQEWKVLFANLNDRDGGAVIAALGQLNIQHRFSEGGGAVMVPANQVHEARLKLASQGLPRGGAVGFELLENQKFGVTQFQERLNFQRGLEGELARSIMALSAVQSARVHLALPSPSAFMREQQKPSASILLTIYGGRTLDRNQIAGIVHLVASSVQNLAADAVSVIDQHGNLLSQNGEVAIGLDVNQLQYVRQMEQNLVNRVLAIVEPIVGAGNVRTQVTADVDFTQSESTAETYTPNQGNAPAAIRSQQLMEAPGTLGATGGGVPGVVSNQPPGTTPSPINGTAQALSAGIAAAAAGATTKRDAITNYEVDKTVRVTRNATGSIKRLSAAVVVNNVSTASADGKVTTKPLSPAQIEQITALVREAIGYSKERGDTLSVANAPFNVAEAAAVPAVPIWKDPEIIELVRNFAPWIVWPILALIVILGLVRPAIKLGRTNPVIHTLEATVHDPISLPSPSGAAPTATGAAALSAPTPGGQQAQLEDIRQLARQNPATVANVVRNWVNQPG